MPNLMTDIHSFSVREGTWSSLFRSLWRLCAPNRWMISSMFQNVSEPWIPGLCSLFSSQIAYIAECEVFGYSFF